MRAAVYLGEMTGHLSAEDSVDILETIAAYGPIPPLDGISAENLLARLVHDKKTVQGKVHFVLPVRIGEVKVVSGSRREAGARGDPVRPAMKRHHPGGAAQRAGGGPLGARHVRPRGARYDLANHLLSGNIDRLLARATVRRVPAHSGAAGCARARYLLRHGRSAAGSWTAARPRR